MLKAKGRITLMNVRMWGVARNDVQAGFEQPFYIRQKPSTVNLWT